MASADRRCFFYGHEIQKVAEAKEEAEKKKELDLIKINEPAKELVKERLSEIGKGSAPAYMGRGAVPWGLEAVGPGPPRSRPTDHSCHRVTAKNHGEPTSRPAMSRSQTSRHHPFSSGVNAILAFSFLASRFPFPFLWQIVCGRRRGRRV